MKLKITSVLIALATSSFGASITLQSFGDTYNGQDDYGILLSTGTPVAPSAGVARVIVFSSLTNAQVSVLAAAQDYATLFAPGNFVTITSDGFTGIASAYGPTAGFVSAAIKSYVPTVVNQTMYAYITSGSELGLFRTNSTLIADPASPTPENSYALTFAPSNGTPIIGAYGPDYVVPSYGPNGAANVTVNSFQLAATEVIPEPSAALLGALGALGLLRRRRI